MTHHHAKTQTLKVIGLVLVAAAALMGCFVPFIVPPAAVAPIISFDDVLQAKGEGKGTVEVYAVPADQFWEITKTVFGWAELDQIREYRAEGYVLAKSSSRWRPTLVGAWVEPTDENQTKVTVVRRPLSLFTRLSESTFHEWFARAMEIVQAGNPLPPEAPEQAGGPQKTLHTWEGAADIWSSLRRVEMDPG